MLRNRIKFAVAAVAALVTVGGIGAHAVGFGSRAPAPSAPSAAPTAPPLLEPLDVLRTAVDDAVRVADRLTLLRGRAAAAELRYAIAECQAVADDPATTADTAAACTQRLDVAVAAAKTLLPRED